MTRVCKQCGVEFEAFRKSFCSTCIKQRQREVTKRTSRQVLSPYLHKVGLEWMEREKKNKKK